MDPETIEQVEDDDTQVAPTDGADGGNDVDNGGNDGPDYKSLYEQAKANSRKWEARAKKNTDEQVAELRAELDALKSEQKRSGLIDNVASELGVNRDILKRMTGDSEDDIRANAAMLADLTSKNKPAPAKPSVPDGGESRAPGITREQIESIKDPVKRIRAIAANRELFD